MTVKPAILSDLRCWGESNCFITHIHSLGNLLQHMLSHDLLGVKSEYGLLRTLRVVLAVLTSPGLLDKHDQPNAGEGGEKEP